MRISMGMQARDHRREMLVGGTGIGYFVWNEWNNLNLANVISRSSRSAWSAWRSISRSASCRSCHMSNKRVE